MIDKWRAETFQFDAIERLNSRKSDLSQFAAGGWSTLIVDAGNLFERDRFEFGGKDDLEELAIV